MGRLAGQFSGGPFELFPDRDAPGLGTLHHTPGIFRKTSGDGIGLPAFEKQQVLVRPGLIKGIVYIPFPGHPVKVLWGLHLDAVRGGPVVHELAHRLFSVGCLAGPVRFLDLPAHRQTRLGQYPARELCRLDRNCYGTSGNVLVNQPYGLTFSSSSPVFYPAQDEQNPETRAITLRNAGNTTVTLAAPPEATYCTISGFTEGQSLESGKTLTFYVTPKTNLVPGTYQENIIIRGIAPDGGIATGTLTVEVRVSEANRNVTFSTSGLNFGYWQEGQTPQERGVEIRNNGNISLSLKVELDEAVEKGFTYELRAGTDATPPVLPAPQNYQDKRSLWLYLVPKAGLPAGDYSGNVTVKDAYSGAVLGTVSVSYFAQQAQIEVTGKDGTLLATASAGNNGAATLDFGEMPYGYTPAQYSQAVTVKNTGNVAVEVGYTGGSDWLASSDSLSSTLQPGATRTMTFTVPAGKGLGQQTREPGTESGGNIWVRMQNDVQAFARVYLGYTFTVTKPATWGEWLYDAQAQTLTRLSDNLTLKNVTASGTSLTIGRWTLPAPSQTPMARPTPSPPWGSRHSGVVVHTLRPSRCPTGWKALATKRSTAAAALRPSISRLR